MCKSTIKPKKKTIQSSFFKVFIFLVATLFLFEIIIKMATWYTCKESWWWWWGKKCEENFSVFKVTKLNLII